MASSDDNQDPSVSTEVPQLTTTPPDTVSCQERSIPNGSDKASLVSDTMEGAATDVAVNNSIALEVPDTVDSHMSQDTSNPISDVNPIVGSPEVTANSANDKSRFTNFMSRVRDMRDRIPDNWGQKRTSDKVSESWGQRRTDL